MRRPRSNKGKFSTPENPGRNHKGMQWIQQALKTESDECLIWPFSRRRNGYGQTYSNGLRVDTHRLVCIAVHGEPPTPKHQASHSCGNGQLGCVNPRHIRWKTPSENLKERWASKPRGPRRYLTPDQVLEIRSIRGVESPDVTGARYGVSEANVRRIQTGKNWKCLPHAFEN